VSNRDSFSSPSDNGGADHLKPGLELPPVVLPATDGSDICLAKLPGRSVIVIYPWTGRPDRPNPPDWDVIPGAHGSTPELEGFRDMSPSFAERGARIFALSRQTTEYQSEMATRLALPFPILSDAEGRFAAALALPSFATGGEVYLKRLTLLLSDGRIEWVFYPVFEPALHAADVVRWLAAQTSPQRGEVGRNAAG
jgi:peroxiredoxin